MLEIAFQIIAKRIIIKIKKAKLVYENASQA